MSKLSGDSEWALVLSPEVPYPVAGGGAIRTASLCRFLSDRFRLHLVTFAAGDGEACLPAGAADQIDWIRLPVHEKTPLARAVRNASRLARGALPLSDRFARPESLERMARIVEGRRYRLALIEHFWCASYCDIVRRHADRVVLDLHNVESALHARCARSEGWLARLAHGSFARVAEREERRRLPQFDLVLTASEEDRARVLRLAPSAAVEVYPNAIPLPPLPRAEEENCIAFSGNLEYHPNVAAVGFFASRIWPRLREIDPGLSWRLIGKNHHAVRRWTAGDSRIEVTGPVEDAVAELARSRLVVAPLLAGSGTRIKILEAWAAGRAVVSTRVGAEGLPARDGDNLLLADDPSEFAESVIRLLKDEELRRRLGAAGRRTVEEQFCWAAVWPGLEHILRVELGKLPSCDSPLMRTQLASG